MVKKLVAVFKKQLTQGGSPKALAVTCAIAGTLGIFPLIGTTTLLCLIAGFAFKLNQPIVQALNYLLYPFQILMIPVFLRIGEKLVGAPPVTINPLQLAAKFSNNWQLFLQEYGMAGLHAVLAWTLIAPFLGVVIFHFTRPTFERLARKGIK